MNKMVIQEDDHDIKECGFIGSERGFESRFVFSTSFLSAAVNFLKAEIFELALARHFSIYVL